MDRRAQIEAAIEAQQKLRGSVSDDVIDVAIEALRATISRESSSKPRRKLVTVLFADLAGFTSWSEGADAEDVGSSMQSVWEHLDRIVLDHHGTIDKHIGDSLMAIWGAQNAREDDPEQAIRAALEIREAFVEIADTGVLAGSGLELRVGINTGHVILREVGSTGELTALGDAVNIAARLESAAPTDRILISHDTYRHVRGVFEVAEQSPIHLKGKREALRTYVVSGVRPRAFRLEIRGVEGVESRMVGREAELAELSRTVEEAAAKVEGRRITIIGEAGLGKSRLIYEFIERLQLSPDDMYLLQARADIQQSLTAFALVRDLLFFRFDIGHDEPSDGAVAKFISGFQRYGGLDPDEALWAARVVGLDVRSRQPAVASADDPELLRDRGSRAILELVVNMTKRFPVVVVVEDLHWADQASVDMLDSVARSSTSAPVSMIATARPTLSETQPEWVSRSRTLALSSLSLEATRELAADLLRNVSYLPEGFLDAVVEAAEGNPFYVEEYVRWMIDSGMIEITEAGWEVETRFNIVSKTPPTLTALLQARLDSLTTSERVVLQRASVVGRVFWDAAIDFDGPPRGGQENPGVVGDLDFLTKRELVIRHFNSAFRDAREFSFNHNLLRDVTYESVLKEDRPVYHEAVARWLIQAAEQGGWEVVIADHLEKAGSGDAAEWHLRAARGARLRYANQEAVVAYQRALSMEGLDQGHLFEAYDGLGDLLVLLARYEEALRAHSTMLQLARETGDTSAEARALTGLVFARLRIGSTDELTMAAEDALTAVENMVVPDDRLHSVALRGASFAALRAGEIEKARERAEMAVAAAESVGDMRGLGLSLNILSQALAITGDYRAADDALERALQIDRRRGDTRNEGASLINLGENARRRGDYQTAADRYLEALEIHRINGDVDNEALSLNNLGGAYVGLGRHQEAVEALREAISAFETANRTEFLSEAKRFMAQAELGLGDLATAADYANEALTGALATGFTEHVALGWRVLGLVAQKLGGGMHVDALGGQRISTEEAFRRSVDASVGDPVERAITLAAWARSIGDQDEQRARRLWQDASEILDPMGLGHLAHQFEE